MIAAAAFGGAVFAVYGFSSTTPSAAPQPAAGAAAPSASATTSLPVAVTRPASEVAATTATLHGSVEARGGEAWYWFEYSPDPLLGAISIRATPRIFLAEEGRVTVETEIFGLAHSATYYFRLVAIGAGGIARGDRLSFTTK